MDKVQSEKFDDGLLPQKGVLNIIGIWPTNINDFSAFVRFLFAAIINISCMCCTSVELYQQCVSADDMMDAFSVWVSSIAVGVKSLIYRINSKHSRIIIDSMVEDWSIVEDPRHKRIMADFFRAGKIVFVAFISTCYASAPLYIAKFNGYDRFVKKQIMKLWGVATESSNSTSFSEEMTATTCIFGMVSWHLRIWIVILQSMQIVVLICGQCGGDGCFFSLTMHLCSQFKILRMNLEEIKFEELDAHRKFGDLVERHCYLIKLTDDLKESFRSIVLLQLLCSVVMICAEGFVLLLSLEAKDTILAWKSTSLMFTMLIQLYVYAYAGDILESQAAGVANAVYSSSWYFLRGNAAKDVSLVINRGHLSCCITAGKFVPMNLFVFKEALKTSASYLSVLRVMIKTQ